MTGREGGRARSRTAFDVVPFRGLRPDPEVVGDLATVTAPPYDVVEPGRREALAAASPYNVVHLTRPTTGRHGGAAELLDAWQRCGAYRLDDRPALYVLEEARDGEAPHRSLVGAVAVSDPVDGVVLPHEDVMPGPVADRLALRRATGADLDPVLLLAEGARGLGKALDAVAAARSADAEARVDGAAHRVWVVDEPDALDALRAPLSCARALIADGHHRYATYLQHRDELRAVRGPGPWDFALAAVVDGWRHPLRVGPIHRSVAGLDPREAVAALEPWYAVREMRGDEVAAALDTAADGSFAVAAERRAWLAIARDLDAVVARVDPAGASADWRALDAAVLHGFVLPQVWGVADERRIGYHHDAGAAVAAAGAAGTGTAVLLRPVEATTAMRLAVRGERMPRKSTSFGPKPLSGLVLRTFDS